MNEINKEKILVTASLLHDVGKYMTRNKMNVSHQKWGDRIKEILNDKTFTHEEIELISKLILYHHYRRTGESVDLTEEMKKLLDILVDSDHTTASEREEKDDITNPQKSFLYDIFKLNEDIKFVPRPLFYSPDERVSPYFIVKNNKIEPQEYHFGKKDEIENYGNLYFSRILNSFENDVKNLEINDFNGWINSLVHIIKNYFQFVASDAYRGKEDIPLFEHLKLTAAVALSKYRTNGKMRLILLETSGIQKFITEGKEGEQSKNYAKSMRGRSFFIYLLTDAVWRYIRKELHLFDFNIIRNVGGNLLLISPDYVDIDKKLQKIEDDVNKFLLDAVGENPSIAISSISIDENDFNTKNKSFYEKIKKLYQQISIHKLHKYNRILDFISKEQKIFNINKRCAFCGKREKNNNNYCNICSSMIELGSRLMRSITTTIYVSYENKSMINFDFNSMKISYGLENNGEECILINKYEIKKMPFSIILYAMTNIKETFNEMINMKINNKIVETKIASFSSDIDNLSTLHGYIIGDNYTPSRYSYYSFLLDFIYVSNLLKLANKNNIYIVFSGGDDVKLIGSFYNIIKFSMDFYDNLRKMILDKSEDSSNNDDVPKRTSQSAGIFIASKKYPSKKLIEGVENEMMNAKEIKDKISIFGIVMNWESFKESIKLMKNINDLKISTSAIFDLFQVTYKYYLNVTNEKIINPWSIILYRLRDLDELRMKQISELMLPYFEKYDKNKLKKLVLSLKFLLMIRKDSPFDDDCEYSNYVIEKILEVD